MSHEELAQFLEFPILLKIFVVRLLAWKEAAFAIFMDLANLSDTISAFLTAAAAAENGAPEKIGRYILLMYREANIIVRTKKGEATATLKRGFKQDGIFLDNGRNTMPNGAA